MTKIKKTILLSCLLCFGSIFAQGQSSKPLQNGDNRKYNGPIPAAEPPTIHASNDKTIITLNPQNHTIFEKPRIVSKNDRGITIRIKGVRSTSGGNQEFTSIIKTFFKAKHSPGKVRDGELTITFSFSDQPYISHIRVHPYTLGLPFQAAYTSATGFSCDFIKENTKSWVIKSSEKSSWTITPGETSKGTSHYLASNGTETTYITISGDGDTAMFYITPANGETYAIPAMALGF